MNYKIAIAGFGFVGQAVYGSLNKKGIDNCVLHDPPQGLDNFDELLKCDLIFCCLPTPDKEGKQDFSYYREFLNKLKEKDFKGVLVIKSTLLYKNIESYTKELNIVMKPIFIQKLPDGNGYEYVAKVDTNC